MTKTKTKDIFDVFTMTMTRRDLLKLAASAGITLAVPTWLYSTEAHAQPGIGSMYATLVDTRKCVNCKSCQITCKVWNENIPDPTSPKTDFTSNTFTYVKEREIGYFPNVKYVTAKRQCMHCVEPVCVEVCPMNGTAMHKEPDGPVLLTQENCIKCQQCVRNCPYGVPQFDQEADMVKKCVFCVERLRVGDQPACVGTCSPGAMVSGTIDQIRDHVQDAVDDSYPVYGLEGTSWIYIFPKGVDPLELIDVSS